MDHIPSVIKRIRNTKIIIWIIVIIEIIDLFLLITKGNGKGPLLSVRIFTISYTYLGGFLFLKLTNKLDKKMPFIRNYEIFITNYNIYISSIYLIYMGIYLMVIEELDPSFQNKYFFSYIIYSIGAIWHILSRYVLKQQNKISAN